jgi:hypothetical protein
LFAQVFDSNRDVSHTSFLPRIAQISLSFLCHELHKFH